MATNNDTTSRKRSFATYGKARRRPGPDYLAPAKAFKDDTGGNRSRQYSVPRNTEPTAETSIQVQPPQARPSPVTDDPNVFDFPSDSDNGTSCPDKRKRIAKQPLASPKRIKKEHVEVKKAATADTSNGRAPHTTPKRNISSKARAPKSSIVRHRETRPSGEEISNPTNLASLSHVTSGAKHGLLGRAKAKPDTTIRGEPPSTTAPKKDKGQGTQRHNTYSPTNDRSQSITSRRNSPVPKSPTRGFDAPGTTTPVRDNTDSGLDFSGRSTPTGLTPKSVKMWNGLLGDDFDGVSRQATKDTTVQDRGANRRLPRRRLIDSFAEKKASKSVPAAQRSDIGLKRGISDVPPDTNLTTDTDKPASVAVGQPAIVAPQAPGPRITYSSQRSMLAEHDLLTSIEPSSSQSQDEAAETPRRRRGAIPTLTRLHSLDEDNEEDDKQPGGGIRTFHELRQAGANKRFVDEVEDLSERIGVPTKQPSMRRSGLLDLISKTHDKAFLKSLISNGMDQRLFLRLGDETDIISGFIIASILVILLNSTASPIATSHLLNKGFSDFISRLLKVDDNITSLSQQRKTNMSKLSQTLLAQEHKQLLEMQIWGDVQPKKLSPRLVALACLYFVVKQNRESGIAGSIVSDEIAESLFSIVNLYTEEISWQPTGPLQFADLHLTISILELSSLGLSSRPGDTPWGGRHLAIVREITHVALRAAPSELSSTKALVLGLALNITNNNSLASEIFSTAGFIHDAFNAILSDSKLLLNMVPGEKQSTSVDGLILTIGIMINLVEWSDRANEPTRALDNGSLRDAVRVFVIGLEKAPEVDSVEEANLNVTFGYLAVLLGYLALTKDTARQMRLDLPGHSLKPLIVAVDEFIDHHRQVDTQSGNGVEVQNSQSGLTEKLSRMLARLGTMAEESQ
ncbi:hypothetical protein VC83_00548 [Pseudogymnoascus destructans]|uniref:Wings apart-like protein C-terminal domain-containing protein n=2 Tax=Pseudogymnoascus destructans TaxID=655981 RepID=L8GC54_PSED2|nr:uncharacterized protein VC83_00548 [Pseudogymnoascus destructans]ELR10459.1 hypothetical protein GMDG_00871 [Pseudogymnoascus destructans 20631-21]OAF63352.1 hypothetical protein VC83_00548 [Pseudogymnoascus destructans]